MSSKSPSSSARSGGWWPCLTRGTSPPTSSARGASSKCATPTASRAALRWPWRPTSARASSTPSPATATRSSTTSSTLTCARQASSTQATVRRCLTAYTRSTPTSPPRRITWLAPAPRAARSSARLRRSPRPRLRRPPASTAARRRAQPTPVEAVGQLAAVPVAGTQLPWTQKTSTVKRWMTSTCARVWRCNRRSRSIRGTFTPSTMGRST
mmetsp:Transcript_28576/g.76959  ORF Transcript_28576/g.76959 Transcript_28576/m.76959 type:complete len:211 (-) Transcript_28576:29-661(-)